MQRLMSDVKHPPRLDMRQQRASCPISALVVRINGCAAIKEAGDNMSIIRFPLPTCHMLRRCNVHSTTIAVGLLVDGDVLNCCTLD